MAYDPASYELVYGGETFIVKLTPIEEKIVRSISSKKGAIVTKVAILHAMYGDREDGGPEQAERTMWVCLSKIRRKLGGTRLRIEGVHSYGFALKVLDKPLPYRPLRRNKNDGLGGTDGGVSRSRTG